MPDYETNKGKDMSIKENSPGTGSKFNDAPETGKKLG